MKKQNDRLDSTSDLIVSDKDIEAVGRVIHSLERMISSSKPATSPSQENLVVLAKRIRAVRHARNEFFDSSLFGEPAWDMLLALFLASAGQYRLKITDLINESEAKASTALRWIKRFEELGLIVRMPNPFDSRSSFVELTPEANQRVTDFLQKIWTKHFQSH